MAQQSIEYGRRQGHGHCVFPFPVGASEVFKKKGGAFVIQDGSGRVEIAAGAEVGIIGHALFNEDFTASATEGANKVPVDMSWDSVWELPVNSGTWADTMRGKVCDLSVSSSIQGVALAASTNDEVILVDKGTTNPAGTVVSVLVMRNPNTQVLSGVV